MKRSRSIRLILMGSAASLVLGACDQAPDPLAQADFMRDEQACAAMANPDACRQALMDARRLHVQTAPRSATREACEEQFGVGQCVSAEQAQAATGLIPAPGASATEPSDSAVASASPAPQGGGSGFLPWLIGYQMGSAMNGGYSATPLYRDTANTAYRPGGVKAGTIRSAPRPSAPSATVARGGFGRSGISAAS